MICGQIVRKKRAIARTKILLWNSKDVRFRNCTWRGKITNIAEEVSDRIDLLLYMIKIYVYFKYDFRTCTFKKKTYRVPTSETSVLMELGEL